MNTGSQETSTDPAIEAEAPTPTLLFRLPEAEPPNVPCRHEFFVGFWHPDGTVRARAEASASIARRIEIQSGPNWLLVGSRAEIHGGSPGLIHRDPSGGAAVAFRGYLVDPPLHTYSDSSSIVRVPWVGTGERNGLFAVARVEPNALVLLTDILGLCPLYYREYRGGIAFSTSSRYLKFDGDRADMVAWRQMLQVCYMAADRSLIEEVRMLPAGSRLIADGSGIRVMRWFDFDSLPDGRRRLDAAALAEVEACFQRAVDRCLALPGLRVRLPLSSGHDSRRILAALRSRDVEFEALTARVFQKEHRDLDATFASQMASDMGFAHRIIEPATPEQYRLDDERRCALVDAETQFHTWAVRLFDALPNQPCLVFDGLLGDVLANPGYRLAGLYESTDKDISLIADYCYEPGFEKILWRDAWPSLDEIREDLRQYLRGFGRRGNIAEFAFMLLRSRRMNSPWVQQLLPAGHVVVCPYADLDYLRLMLSFLPAEKHQKVAQRLCLEAFWPEYARYPGNRDIPDTVPPGRPTHLEMENRIRVRRLLAAARRTGAWKAIPGLLTPYAATRVVASLASRLVLERSAWYIIPLLEMLDRTHASRVSWTEERSG